MPAIEPDYLRPAIGYAYWHLSRGTSFEATQERLLTHEAGEGLTPGEIDAVMSFAMQDLVATQRVQAAGPDKPIGEYYSVPVTHTDVVGVRVLATIEGPPGQFREVSVTVNVEAGALPSEIVQMVGDFISSNGLSEKRPGYDNVSIIGMPEIVQLFSGGFNSPVLTR